MSEPAASLRNDRRRRVVRASVGMLAILVASGLVLAFAEKWRDVSDRAG